VKDPTEIGGGDGSSPHSQEAGAAYLSSLKHGELSSSALENTPADSKNSEAPQGAERRRSARYRCQGSVRFRTEEDIVHTYGTLTDVSLHGCYVEMMATSPLGTKVNMILEVNGIRACVHGEVRVSYPFLGMGIEFTDVDSETRKLLRDITLSVLPHVNAMSSAKRPLEPAEPVLIPIITDPAAALGVIADHFQANTTLARQDFLRLIQKSQPSR
jgi:hypothetical protein